MLLQRAIAKVVNCIHWREVLDKADFNGSYGVHELNFIFSDAQSVSAILVLFDTR
ncbi:hypothetical protein AVDCRST_MAG94-634 [uncultured Leptolyngbya sp.]|uniref:Uncharacterized protein n=2 Tax=Cyanophyceae TaxID=3028117 RepID=A0A6J4KHP7_9CYAN|nr:hypothetical protein AVDCRST_MAG94-634 [uncultured Leptolyngbya sp.]CAA9577001.1 hypothetical protein AVDCRST_MAG81-2379 [uncultured Synechococcales cyanobacterium]